MSVPADAANGAAPRVRRVLVYRLGSLGDMLIALPALHLVARAYPGAERRLLTNVPVSSKAPAAAAILDGSGLVDGYLSYTVGTRNPLQLLSLAWRVRRFRPDVLIYLAAARGVAAAQRDGKFFRLICGVRRLVGVPVTEDLQQPRVSADGTLEPEAARLARNLAALGDAALPDPANWDLHLQPAEQATAAEALRDIQARRILAVSVGTKVQAKDWGRDNWRALLARIAEMFPGRALVLIGAQAEVETSEFAAEGWRAARDAGPVLNLCGRLTPRESAAVLAQAELFVGHDSGPMHLAAAVQTPCVAIFAARNRPRVWFPYGPRHRVLYHRVDCWGCELETCTEQRRKCLLSITVDEVAEAVRAVLAETVPARTATIS